MVCIFKLSFIFFDGNFCSNITPHCLCFVSIAYRAISSFKITESYFTIWLSAHSQFCHQRDCEMKIRCRQKNFFFFFLITVGRRLLPNVHTYRQPQPSLEYGLGKFLVAGDQGPDQRLVQTLRQTCINMFTFNFSNQNTQLPIRAQQIHEQFLFWKMVDSLLIKTPFTEQ